MTKKLIDGFKRANLLTPGEPEEDDPLSDTVSDPLSEPPFFDFIDPRELSEERRVQGGVGWS